MVDNRKLEIQLLLEDKAALSKLKKALGDIEAQSKSTASTFGANWKTVALQITAVIAATEGLRRFMVGSIEAAVQQEDAINRLNVALKNQGTFTEELSQRYQSMATAIQRSTRFSDEAISQVQQTLVALGNVGPEQMDRVVRAVLDFSTATGKDLESSAQIFAKAAQGNVTALGKMGISVDENIPKFQKLAEVLRVTEQRFGGAAQADLDTYAGKTARLANAWDDFLEAIGRLIITSPEVKSGIDNITESLQKMSDYLDTNRTGLQAFATQLGETFMNFSGAGFAGIGEQLSSSLGAMFSTMTTGGPAGAGQTILETLFGGTDAQQRVVQTAQDTALQLQMLKDEQDQLKLQKEAEEEARRFTLQEQDFQDTLLHEQTKIDAQRQQLLAWYDEKSAMAMAQNQRETEFLQFALDTQKKAHESLWTVAGKARDTFSAGMSNMLVNMMKGTGSVKEAFVDLGWQMIKILTDYIVQLTINFAIAKAMQAAHLATTIPIASATAAAWAPAAAMASLASYGANSAPAMAGIAMTVAFAKALSLLSSISGAAEGATVTGAGSVLVGEKGPELLNLPRGASVIPLDRSGGGTQVEIHMYNPVMRSEEDIAELARQVSEYIDVYAR